MKTIYTRALSLLLSAFAIAAAAQTVPLEGTVIGTQESVDYTTGNASDSVNTKECAFDDDLSTFFASYERSLTWAGLDLGRKYVITKVAYASSKGYPERMQLGVFEGANSPDFTDAVPIYLIKDIPEDNTLVTKAVSVTRAFRYVRYVGPNDTRCRVAELKFYGYQYDGSDSKLYTPTNLPLVVIHTDSAKPITSKTEYVPGIISIISDNGKTVMTDSMEIRGRGNFTWTLPKKPYKIKLNNKARLLGMPAKAKKWTLLSNYDDKTLIRNLLAFKVSECMGMTYTPAGRLVDVMLNGEYEGSYQLCDQVEVRKNRVEVTEMTTQDNSEPEISGGYLVEIEGHAAEEKKHFTSSHYDLSVSIKYPDDEDLTDQQFAYIKQAFNRMTSRLDNSLYLDSLLGFRPYLDEESFLKHFLIEEFVGNADAYWSVFMYKDRGSQKFYTGPAWDFDLAFENDSRIHPVSSIDGFIYAYENSMHVGDMPSFVSKVIGVNADWLKFLWSEARNKGGLTLDNLNSYIDSLTEEIDESQQLNFIRWPILNTLIGVEYQTPGTYEGEVKTIRDYLEFRIPWMDSKIGLIPVGIKNISISQFARVESVSGGISISNARSGAVFTVYDAAGMQVAKKICNDGTAVISLSPGVYIVRAEGDGMRSAAKKLVVR